MTSQNRRGAGRAARHQQRQTKGAIAHPCPPGQIGGAYRPLSEKGVQDIIDTAYRLLAEIGMGEVPPQLQEMALAGGATLNEAGRLCYSRALIEDVINQAPKQFPLYGRNPAHDIEIGGDRTEQVGQRCRRLTQRQASIAQRHCMIYMNLRASLIRWKILAGSHGFVSSQIFSSLISIPSMP